jgi:hypothetical protein
VTPAERQEALEAARWYASGRVGELSPASVALIARLLLELDASLSSRPRVLTAAPKHVAAR